MRGVPGKPILDLIKNAPSPLMGVGAALIITGLCLMVALSAGEKNQILIYIGVGGVISMFVGVTFVVIGHTLFERRWKKQDKK